MRDSRRIVLGQSQLGWIDEVIGRIDPGDGHGDRFQVRRRIIVSRRIDLIPEVVGIQPSDALRQLLGQPGFRRFTVRQINLHGHGCCPNQHQQVRRSSQTLCGLGLIVSIQPGWI